ncbi:MAG: redox-sensing transcriptional repressor Rex [Kineosporiaceae bacterium]
MSARPAVTLGRAAGGPAPVRVAPLAGAADGSRRAVPEATAGRLPGYLHALHTLADHGTATVSSHALAARVGVSPAKLRKDLSYLGSFGTRGVGYDVGYLIHAISAVLGVADTWDVAIAGAGNLGRALAHYEGFAERGLRVTVLFDVDPAVIGTRVGRVPVHDIADAPRLCRAAGIAVGVVAVPAAVAQDAADLLVAGGVTSLLSFAAAALTVPDEVHVRHVDLSAELQLLGFHEFRRRRAPGGVTSA